jgi:FixJ family two-component response regulator
MHRVATYQDYMEGHKIEILEQIKKGWQVKQIAKTLDVSVQTLSDYLYLWGNGYRRKKQGNICSVQLKEELPVMERISIETRKKMEYNTAVNKERVKMLKFPEDFFGDTLIMELLDGKIMKGYE